MIETAIRITIAIVATAAAVRFVAAIRQAKNMRQLKCVLVNGKHDLLRAHSDTRIFQRCVCGYETTGITIDRRDRRLHLVANNPQPRRDAIREDFVGYAHNCARLKAGR